MIIELLINLIYVVFSALTLVIKVPGMPVKVIEIMATVVDYITSGIAVVSNFIDMSYVLILFSLVAIVDVAVMLYHVIMWVLRKIPILGIE